MRLVRPGFVSLWQRRNGAEQSALTAALGFAAQRLARRQRPDPWKGLVIGALGGAAGTLLMGYYFQALAALQRGDSGGDDDEQEAEAHGPLDSVTLIGVHYQAGEGSTEALGRIVYQTLAGSAPESRETKTLLSELVHWSFGTAMGALYGAARGGRAAAVDVPGGALFGASVWLFASETMIPLLGLAPGPTAQPAARHAQEFGAHIVYGIAAAATTQGLYRLL